MLINAMTSCLVKLNGDGDGDARVVREEEGGVAGGGRSMRYTFKF